VVFITSGEFLRISWAGLACGVTDGVQGQVEMIPMLG